MGEVERIVERMTASVLNNKDALISLLRIKDKDEYTYTHCVAVSAHCISFGERLGFDPRQIKAIGVGGLLHDFGKVKVPNEILKKTGRLTDQEFEIMKRHVEYGHAMLKDATRIEEGSISVVINHHERLDGTGYPMGLKGNQISSFGQLAAIIDVYDALTSDRCYRDSMPPTDALKKIFEWSPLHLNRELAEQFVAHIGIYPIGSVVRLASGLIGVVVGHGESGLLYPTVRVIFDKKEKRYVEPMDINLSKAPVDGDSDRIVACESAARYKINFLDYLT
jgi:putative nucleotidyltransferase with HDIG domain